MSDVDAATRDAIRAAIGNATQGPWTVDVGTPSGETIHYEVRTVDKLPEHPWSPRFVCWMNGGLGDWHGYERDPDPARINHDGQARSDADFIVLARSAVPDLLAALERVEAERDAANAKVLAQHRRIVELERDGRRLYSQVWAVRDAKATVEADNDRLAARYAALTEAFTRAFAAGDHAHDFEASADGLGRCYLCEEAEEAWAEARAVLAASDTPTGDAT